MNILPININDSTSHSSGLKRNPNFKTRLNLTFSPHSIPCNYNRGETEFNRVINKFKDWLANQHPQYETLTIRQKNGKMTNQRVIRGAGGDFIESRQENLELSMPGAKCGFCWNPQSSEDAALEDLKSTFDYVKSQAGF